ncbi:MAG: hypothetical protein WCP32_18630 [Bacteroidota bacterium]
MTTFENRTTDNVNIIFILLNQYRKVDLWNLFTASSLILTGSIGSRSFSVRLGALSL